jgi:hypothetical protein
MTDNQENKLSAYEASEAVLDIPAHKTIVDSIVEFKPYITRFKSLLGDIRTIRLVQERDNKGIAITKSEFRDQLTTVVFKVINALKTHARITHNSELLEVINYKISDLTSARDNILVDIATLIHDTALPLKTDLAKYLVTEAEINSIITLKDQFLSHLPAPRVAVAGSKTATSELKQKFIEIDALLKNDIDVFMEIFRPSYPNFVEQYTNSRIIVDLGHRKSGTKYAVIQGAVLHFETLLPLVGATVRDIETGKNTTTDSQGKYKLNFSESGTYTIQVEMSGFITNTQDPVTIQVGNSLTLDIELEPEPEE